MSTKSKTTELSCFQRAWSKFTGRDIAFEFWGTKYMTEP